MEEDYFKRIRDIRIFVLSEKDPDSEDDEKIKEYLTEKLPIKQEGKYYFQKKPRTGPVKKTLILFRTKKAIVGCGILRSVNDAFNDGKEENGIEYIGHCQFDPESIKYFEKPILKEDFEKEIEKFGYNAQTISKIKYLKKIKAMIEEHYDNL